MEGWIEFGRGPLFRLAFSLMILGLLRILAMTVLGVVEAYRRSPDRIVPWQEVVRQTLGWLVPVRRLWRMRPAYSSTSLLFHAGLIVVPLFLAAHVLLWRNSAGFAWPALPQKLADWLTLLAIVTGLGLFASRVAGRRTRALSRLQDYCWPLLLVTPLVTGYICSHAAIGPKAYQQWMLAHLYSADLIMVMIPFTKIAHCVLAPLSQLVTAVSWKFVPGAGDRVAATLGHADRPCWVDKARHGAANPGPGATQEVLAK